MFYMPVIEYYPSQMRDNYSIQLMQSYKKFIIVFKKKFQNPRMILKLLRSTNMYIFFLKKNHFAIEF